jgi:hypothetical protein
MSMRLKYLEGGGGAEGDWEEGRESDSKSDRQEEWAMVAWRARQPDKDEKELTATTKSSWCLWMSSSEQRLEDEGAMMTLL